MQRKLEKKIGIDVDVKPETVTEENVLPAAEASKAETAPAAEAKKQEASKVETKTEKKPENTSEKK